MASHQKPHNRSCFHIAIICALPLEYDAVSLLFDQFWDEDGDWYGRAPGDTNTYTTGRIGRNDVVLALLPGMGKAAAAGATSNIRFSYTGLKIAMLVGICGGIPAINGDEVLLGDVIISKAVVQYDFGRQFVGKFVAKDTIEESLGRPTKDIRGLVASFETELGRERLQLQAAKYLKAIQDAAVSKRRRSKYTCPDPSSDRLFAAAYRHMHRRPAICAICDESVERYCEIAAKASCAELDCDESQLISRDRLEEAREPAIFVGRIASGDTVMKSGEHRDRVAAEHDVIAFEMEGAGAWDEVPCLIVKGVCDYADSHKNKAWQTYAAATAAAVMRAILNRYPVDDGPGNAGDSQGPPASWNGCS
ncbi:nucleoside phosphorylase domain-containing protein [Stachybotrys elegans]|uniref:Nucleoside phosphorylase domain-containing protein n=1 Tax=Stachybotrys elegans TaxID=80388 RepID=A0A8K0SJ43_9HYPO|nr:nucleoside phosphorylase domain-containing protein [Stachybotrys elegans]